MCYINILCLDEEDEEEEFLAELEERSPEKIWEADQLPEYARSHIVARKMQKSSVEARMKGDQCKSQ